ncbi:zinc-ribbon and DUF3426 domain-containing protein [Pseudomonadales bacterium]|nr:zinc-ribbon and DUF3426 domain-containing protein [Pseudomonadales bacterium]
MAEAGFVCRCPKCETTFRVTETQLAAAHGAVRCGACLQVFAANDYLLEAALSAGESEVVSEHANDAIHDVAEQAELIVGETKSTLAAVSGVDDLVPNQTSGSEGPNDATPDEQRNDLKGDDDSREPTTKVVSDLEAEKNTEVGIDATNADLAAPQVVAVSLGDGSKKILAMEESFASGPEPGEKSNPDFGTNTVVHALDQSSPLGEPDEEPERLEVVPEIQLESLAPDEIVGEYEDVARSHSLRWFVGALLLGLVFVIQFASVNVERLVQNPKLRPYYAFFCNYAECKLPVFENVSAIETTELVIRVHPETERALLVDAIIRNTSAYRQPFPLLEMKFTDINNLVIATRRFLPKEYLGGEMAGLRFIPALTEVRLGLEIVDPGKNAFGYALEAVPAI